MKVVVFQVAAILGLPSDPGGGMNWAGEVPKPQKYVK